MEEVIAKSSRTRYIVSYALTAILGLVVMDLGFALISFIDEEGVDILGWFFVVGGLLLIIVCIIWLIYFMKLPENAVTLKDGKLYFRNGVICTPTEVNTCVATPMWGFDGMIHGIGKLTVDVKGNTFAIKFVKNVNDAANRIFMLKAEYSVKEHISQKQQSVEVGQIDTKANNREENNG